MYTYIMSFFLLYIVLCACCEERQLALFGGEMINGFAIALIVGVMIGTYSSIYVAANTLMLLGVNKEDLMIPVKEGAEQEELTP